MTVAPLEIVPSWEEATGVQAPELAATWARLTITVDGEHATWVERAGTSRNGVFVSAYPLAEWIAFNWWFLRSELRVSTNPSDDWSWSRSAPDSWLHRHNLRAAGSGMPWPDLTIVPEGATTRVRWFAQPPVPGGRGLRYIGTGSAWLSAAAAHDGLESFVEAVVDRLRESGVAGTPLQREWDKLRVTDPEEAAFAEAVARLGLDPYSVDGSVGQRVLELDEHLDSDLLAEFLDSVDPRSLEVAQAWVRDADELLRHAVRPEPFVRSIGPAAALVPGSSRPWQVGYDAARNVRASLGWDSIEPATIDQLVPTHQLRRESGGIEGYVAAREGVALVVPEGASTGRQRFQAATALGLSLLAPARRSFVIDPSATSLAQAARAFAAEMLAPAAGVREYLSALGGPTEASFDAIAQRFSTTATVVRRQFENQVLPGRVE
ncbi:hypothetical protein [Cellulomonas hominis]